MTVFSIFTPSLSPMENLLEEAGSLQHATTCDCENCGTFVRDFPKSRVALVNGANGLRHKNPVLILRAIFEEWSEEQIAAAL